MAFDIDQQRAEERAAEIIESMPAKVRRVYCLSSIDGLSAAEIATRENIRLRDVARLLTKADAHIARRVP